MNKIYFWRNVFLIYSTLLLILFLPSCKNKKQTKFVLETVTALDHRIPAPSKEDMKKIIEEGKKTISMKFGEEIELEFHDNGYISLEDLFSSIQYQKQNHYTTKYKYDFQQMEKANIFSNPEYKKEVLDFLKSWSIESLQKFFPNKKISNYKEVEIELLKTYHQKMYWLTSLKTNKNEPLLNIPLKNHQSYIEWKAFMYDQSKYDVIFTNTIIVLDTINTPYPHSVVKHAKVGGSSFESPKRNPMLGNSLLINFLEEYGNIDGIKNPFQLNSEKKNKIIGGLFFAHEFGHAFFQIPDVYDHPESCLMNASMDSGNMEKSYELLLSDPHPCPKCKPWIQSKKNFIEAEILFSKSQFQDAGEKFLICASNLPTQIDSDRNRYLLQIYSQAKLAFSKVNNLNKIQVIESLESSLR
ncbi:MAG: hypothetical protein L6Q54_12205 [Leptospiraceae bacterium]|nr:hypothetical protein [Leptospiraceae bacterium]MCK6381994.1 hypothetical protein [Leptospiraceae bacterium]